METASAAYQAPTNNSNQKEGTPSLIYFEYVFLLDKTFLMEWLPPNWASTFSESKQRLYYYKISEPTQTQWEVPNWDEQISNSYAQFQTAEPALKPFRSLQNYIKNCLLINYLFSNNFNSILDIGCGKGGDVHKIPESYTYLGIDICPESITEAKKRHPSKSFLIQSFNLKINIETTFNSAMCMFALHYGGDFFSKTLKKKT